MSSDGNTGKGSTRGTSYEGRKRVHQSWHIWGLAGDLPSFLSAAKPSTFPTRVTRWEKGEENKGGKKSTGHTGRSMLGLLSWESEGTMLRVPWERGDPAQESVDCGDSELSPEGGLGLCLAHLPCLLASLEAAMRSLKCQRAPNTGSCRVQIMAYLHTDHTVTSLVAHSPKAEQVSCREEMGTQP